MAYTEGLLGRPCENPHRDGKHDGMELIVGTGCGTRKAIILNAKERLIFTPCLCPFTLAAKDLTVIVDHCGHDKTKKLMALDWHGMPSPFGRKEPRILDTGDPSNGFPYFHGEARISSASVYNFHQPA